jgi:dienelactone hydrolase
MHKPFVLAVFAAILLGPGLARADTIGDCHIGMYRLADASLVDIAPSDGEALRWRRLDGSTGALHPAKDKAAEGRWTSTFGWTGRPDGKSAVLGDCGSGRITFDGHPGRRIAFDVTETKFEGRGVNLAGRLVLPRGRGRVPIVVLLHGSETDSARDFYFLQRLLPSQGIGVFVYDKRGTGASGGQYSQDFDLLADDAVAAMREARRLAGPRAGRVGYQGGSQGGWVAPMAANRAPVDFVVVSFGLAVTVLDEDQEEVALEMKLAGHGPEDTAKALEVASAAEAVMESGFTDGFARFDALKAKYRGEPWYKDLHGNLTRFLLPLDEAELRKRGAELRGWRTPLRYDPMPTLRADTTPQLWILGGEDLDAPSAETGQRISGLAGEGRPFTLALFPHAEHGLTEFETAPSGERLSTRYSPGYFAMMRDFIRNGALRGPYGAAVVTTPPKP